MAGSPPPGDEELMLRAGRGDADAFGELVRRHQDAVVGTLVRMLGSAEGAEDLAQEVFLRAWKSAPRYRPDAKFTTWLFTIARNLLFNECRRRRRSRTLPLEEPPPGSENARELPDPRTPPADTEAMQSELQAAIERALAGLEEPARLAIILRRYEEMPYEDIARVLKLSVPAVKSLLFRARATLRQKLAPWLPKT